MDLGIAGRTALVGGASKGLGYGCALALVREGVNVVIAARGAQDLAAAEQRLLRARPPTPPRGGGATRYSRRSPTPASWSPPPAGGRRAASATGSRSTGCAPSKPPCWRRSR